LPREKTHGELIESWTPFTKERIDRCIAEGFLYGLLRDKDLSECGCWGRYCSQVLYFQDGSTK